MANGWAGDNAVNDQIDATVEDALARARARLEPAGPLRMHCEVCEVEIPAARRAAVPSARMCVSCQSEADEAESKFSGYNRRGSKDSQLR